MGPSWGPVWGHEHAASARRWQTYALRSVYVGSLLGGLVVIWNGYAPSGPQGPVRGAPLVGKWYFLVTVGIQLAMVLLAAPALTAGSICEDRTRGTLDHLLVTDLRAAEIVLGKLGAGLAPALGLIASAIPVAYLASWLGGIDPVALGRAFAVTATMAALGCALALTLSLWARTTHEALLGTYATWALVLFIYPAWKALFMAGVVASAPASWALRISPFWISFAPYLDPEVGPSDFLAFLAVTLGATAALVALSAIRLRPSSLALAAGLTTRRPAKSLLGPISRLLGGMPGPSLDCNPVLWRECRRDRSSRWARLIWPAFAAAYSAAAITSLVGIMREGVGPGPDMTGLAVALLLVAGLLMSSASAATSLTEERMRGSLDLLLATPLRTRSIVWGKWLGTFRAFPILAVWPATLVAATAFGWRRPYPFLVGTGVTTFPKPGMPAAVFAVVLTTTYLLAHGAMIASLGLALATSLPRRGRAAALCATYFVVVCIGWPAFCFALLPNTWPEQSAMCAATLSPFFGFAQLAQYASCPTVNSEPFLSWVAFWTACLAISATILLVLTYLSFDRCLGRVSAWSDELGREAQS